MVKPCKGDSEVWLMRGRSYDTDRWTGHGKSFVNRRGERLHLRLGSIDQGTIQSATIQIYLLEQHGSRRRYGALCNNRKSALLAS